MKFTTHLLAALACACATAITAQGVTVKTILNNGSSDNRYDIVILGDGYQAAEQTKFNNNCQAVITKLFATEPYKTFKPFFNVHTVFRASKDSGADHPDRTPPIVKDTVYDASYNTGGTARCLYIRNTSQATRDAALAPAVEGRIMVIVNDSRYGGCAGTFAVTYNGSSMTTVQVHEFGHSFARLADEYDYGRSGTYTGGEPAQKNVTKDPTGKAKWPLWIGFSGVGAFQGARYYKTGLYRPKLNCIMRTLSAPVCPVCGEQIVIYSYKTTSAIDKPIPASTSLRLNPGVKQTFSFTNIAPASGNPTIQWKINGKVQTTTGTSLVVDTGVLGNGNHQISVVVQDKSAYVRNDPNGDLTSQRTWDLWVGPIAPDLKATFLQISRSTMPAGESLRLDSYAQNIGNQASPSVRVDHFLSTDTTFDASDIYLGGYTQPALDPTKLGTNFRPTVTIPPHVQPGKYYVGMVIDRTNAVKESNENNNSIGSFQMTITKSSCDAQLSYDDPLNYPSSAGRVVASTGGVLHPVVTASCNAGDRFLILLGCSGTSPGTALPPSLTLPLNLDACTDVFYRGIGSPALLNFLGTIDAQGFGRATLTVPKGLSGSVNGHFAAVVFDKNTGAYKRVTNAVNFTFK